MKGHGPFRNRRDRGGRNGVRKEGTMTCKSLDLTIEDALADPVIGAAMRADHVDPIRFESLLRATAQSVERSWRDRQTNEIGPPAPERRRPVPCSAPADRMSAASWGMIRAW